MLTRLYFVDHNRRPFRRFTRQVASNKSVKMDRGQYSL